VIENAQAAEVLMPLARIDLARGKSAEYRTTIGQMVYEAMRATLNVPNGDHFQVITEHPGEGFVSDLGYLGIQRSKDCVFIQVTLNDGRTVDQKRAFYKAIANGLHQRLDLRREDVFINLVEVRKENWSFGNGEAQYAQQADVSKEASRSFDPRKSGKDASNAVIANKHRSETATNIRSAHSVDRREK
jgi:4-oxalocrotonate tautomerase